MADIGHQQTDAVLAEIEDRVRQVYLQAAREAQAKLNDYMRRYRKKDAVWQRRVAAGEVTQQEYTQWRTGQLMMTQRWEEMRDTLAADYHNANAIARSIVNGYMPDVYSLNHNFATFQVEKSGHIDTSYTLYSRETIERILRHEPELLPPPGAQMTRNLAEWDAFKEGRLDEVSAQNLEAFRSLQVAGKDLRWQKGQLQSVMTQAILQGESIPNIAKRVATEMGDYNHKSTIRYARTAVTGAQNAGRQDAYQRATNMGIEMKREWIATIDMRTRHEHRNLDGQKRGVDEPFRVGKYEIMYPGDPSAAPEMTWNCRCTLAAAVSGWEDKTGQLKDYSQIEGMSYIEWQASRVEKPHSITKQEEIAETMRQRYIRELYQPEGRIAASRDWRDVELPALENWTPPDTRRKKRK